MMFFAHVDPCGWTSAYVYIYYTCCICVCMYLTIENPCSASLLEGRGGWSCSSLVSIGFEFGVTGFGNSEQGQHHLLLALRA